MENLNHNRLFLIDSFANFLFKIKRFYNSQGGYYFWTWLLCWLWGWTYMSPFSFTNLLRMYQLESRIMKEALMLSRDANQISYLPEICKPLAPYTSHGTPTHTSSDTHSVRKIDYYHCSNRFHWVYLIFIFNLIIVIELGHFKFLPIHVTSWESPNSY